MCYVRNKSATKKYLLLSQTLHKVAIALPPLLSHTFYAYELNNLIGINFKVLSFCQNASYF